MLPAGWTRSLVAAALLVTGACATRGPATAPIPAGAPDGQVQARYEALLLRLEAGDDAAAVAGLEAFSAAHPDYGGPLLNLALLRARAGDEAGAAALLDRAAAVCSRCGPVWNEIGVLHRRAGRFAAAEAAYQQAIALEPDYALAWFNLAVYYELYGQQPEQALAHYRQYLQLETAAASDADVARWVAELERRVGGAAAQTARVEELP